MEQSFVPNPQTPPSIPQAQDKVDLPQPEEMLITPKAESKKPKLPFILLGILVILLIALVSFFAGKSLNKPKDDLSPTPATLPSETPTEIDDMANWKTYTNEKYSFSFKYSDYFKYLAEIPENSVYLAPKEGAGEGKGTPFGLDPSKDYWLSASATKLDDAGLKYWKDKVSNSNKIVVDGINGYKDQFLPTEASEPAYGYYVVILKNDVLYKLELLAGNEKIGFSSENEQIFDQILSTFRFLDQKAKTVLCQNKNIGISLKIPTDWTCESLENHSLLAKSKLFDLTVSNLGRGPFCIAEPEIEGYNPDCKSTQFYSNKKVTLNIITDKQGGEISGSIKNSSFWISITYPGIGGKDLTASEKTELTSVIDSVETSE